MIEILTFETTWMKLEGILVSEINQRKKNIILSHLYVESKRQLTEQSETMLTNTENKQVVA